MDKFDEYKFFTERVQHRSDRRQQASQIYLTVNTAIFGLIALLIKDFGLSGWGSLIGIIPLFFVGVIVCFTWARIISEFEKLIGWQYEQLREMEKNIKSSYKMHMKEWEEFYKPVNLKERLSFSKLESKDAYNFC
ncbi:MAG: hypothetical protein QM730_06710 [Anaerolineales bacterium]